MYITSIIDNEQDKYDTLIEQQVLALPILGGKRILIRLPVLKEQNPEGPVLYNVIQDIGNATLLVDGLLKHTDEYAVVCSSGGQIIGPYLRESHKGEHFSWPNALVVVAYDPDNKKVSVTKHGIMRKNGTAWIESNEIWLGNTAKGIPKKINKLYGKAISKVTKMAKRY